jgi:hypothetical protein
VGVPRRCRSRTRTAARQRRAAASSREEAALSMADSSGFVPFSALDHARGGEDPLRHLLLRRPGARRSGAESATARSASTCAGCGPPTRLTPTAATRSASSSPRSSTWSSSRSSSPWIMRSRPRAPRDVQPIMPRIVMAEDSAQIVLPGEPGYAD